MPPEPGYPGRTIFRFPDRSDEAQLAAATGASCYAGAQSGAQGQIAFFTGLIAKGQQAGAFVRLCSGHGQLDHAAASGLAPRKSLRLRRKVLSTSSLTTVAITDTAASAPTIAGTAADPVVQVDLTPVTDFDPTNPEASVIRFTQIAGTHLPEGATFALTDDVTNPATPTVEITGDGISAPMAIVVKYDDTVTQIDAVVAALAANATVAANWAVTRSGGADTDVCDTPITATAINPSYTVQDIADVINDDATLGAKLEAIVLNDQGATRADTALSQTDIPVPTQIAPDILIGANDVGLDLPEWPAVEGQAPVAFLNGGATDSEISAVGYFDGGPAVVTA